MKFIDEATIHVRAGAGGDGCVAFGIGRSGPTGGDGGDGGSIIIVADGKLASLLDFKYRRRYEAQRGENGRNKDQYGAGGDDLIVRVPVGTMIYDVSAGVPDDPRSDDESDAEADDTAAAGRTEYRAEYGAAVRSDDGTAARAMSGDEGSDADDDDDESDDDGDEDADDDDEDADDEEGDDEPDEGDDETGVVQATRKRGKNGDPERPRGKWLADLSTDGAQFVVAKGGIGGKGNMHFATPWNQAPRTAEQGTPGVERAIRLELKLLADVGLLGYPNVGKSTFISAVSRAKPKIADYPFTTLVPNLGVVRLSDDRTFVIADIPGLIEGASEGAGLGHQFLRHVERCRVLLHIVEATELAGPDREPLKDFRVINAELARYAPDLATKPQVVVLNKSDSTDEDAIAAHIAAFQAEGIDLVPISAAGRQGLDPILERLWAHLRAKPAE